MKQRKLFAGARLKRLRKGLKLTQLKMAEELGVSASYLNLMERNQRPITAQVLIRLVETYDLNIGVFSDEPQQQTFLSLREAANDPILAALALDDQDLKELNEAHPLGAQAIINLHKNQRNLSNIIAALSEQISGQPVTNKVVHNSEAIFRQIVQENDSYCEEIEEAAELFNAEINFNRRDLFSQLSARLQQLHSIRTRIIPQSIMRNYQRRLDQHSRRLLLSDLLSEPQLCFQMAVQIAHLELRDIFDEKCMLPQLNQAAGLARQLYRDHLAQYFAMAVILPYQQFLKQAEEYQMDVLRLAAKFGTSIEIVIRRLASLSKPEAMGLPIFFMRIDCAGAIIERGGNKSFSFAQAGGNCPKWNLVACLQSAPSPQADFVKLIDGTGLLSIAFAIERTDPNSDQLLYSQIMVFGCASNRAMETVYGRKLGETRELSPSKIGLNCRICERQNCAQRSSPAITLSNQQPKTPTSTSLLSTQWSGS